MCRILPNSNPFCKESEQAAFQKRADLAYQGARKGCCGGRARAESAVCQTRQHLWCVRRPVRLTGCVPDQDGDGSRAL